MARKKAAEEHENHERWLVSYADFITLLFAFFVVMYSISSVNEGKYRVLSDALAAVFRAPAKSIEPIQIGQVTRSQVNEEAPVLKRPSLTLSRTPISIPKPPIQLAKPVMLPSVKIGKNDAQEPPGEGGLGGGPEPKGASAEGSEGDGSGSEASLGPIAEKITRDIADLIDEGLVKIRKTSRWIEIEIRESVMFDSGRAELQAASIPILERIAEALVRGSHPIHVEGHTDSTPISTKVYPSNWELSAGRAASVVHLFTTFGISPKRMAAVGFGEFRPAVDNTSPENRQINRRVVIVIHANPDMEGIDITHKERVELDKETGSDSQRSPDRLDEPESAREVIS